MAEPSYGELFDFYCAAILAELYERRGSPVAYKPDKIAEKWPIQGAADARSEAAWSAVTWLHRHGYADGSVLKNNASLCVPPLGILAYGRPFPGEPKVSGGEKALKFVESVMKSGFNATTSHLGAQILGMISIPSLLASVGIGGP